MTLEQEMLKVLKELKEEGSTRSVGAWEMANKIWDGCMEMPRPGNGARIAHLRRVGERSKKLGTFVNSTNDERFFYLRGDECKK